MRFSRGARERSRRILFAGGASAGQEGLLVTPAFRRNVPWISGAIPGAAEAALNGSIPPAVQQEALRLADRLVREELGGTFWAPPPAPALLAGRRVLVSAGPHPGRNRAMLQAALEEAGSARILVLLARPDRSLHAQARQSGCMVLSGPADPWPMLAGASAIYADSADPLAALARLAGVRIAGPPTPHNAGEVAAAILVLGTRYADPFHFAAIGCAAALDIVAEWRRVTRANRGIAACAGMSFWKRNRMRAFLHDGTRAPPHASSATALAAAARGGAIACWSSRLPAGLAAAGMKVRLVEDGFVRSRGLGSGFLPPCSIIVDATGIYYDPAHPSDLETLLRDTHFAPQHLGRARRLIERMVRESVTKYAAGAGQSILPVHGSRRRILVPGQVSDDLSVVRGGAGIAGNADLLSSVRARNPDAVIAYKPHPDVDAGYRAGSIPDAVALRHADIVVRDIPMASLIAAMDEIHTLTSLAGFEALLRGRTVVTYGQPFYAGWGLTEDLVPPARRGRRLTLEELSAGVLLLYPRYLDPVTELPCSAEILLDRLADPAVWRPTPLMRLRRLQGRLQKASTFFFEKKNQETFATWDRD